MPGLGRAAVAFAGGGVARPRRDGVFVVGAGAAATVVPPSGGAGFGSPPLSAQISPPIKTTTPAATEPPIRPIRLCRDGAGSRPVIRRVRPVIISLRVTVVPPAVDISALPRSVPDSPATICAEDGTHGDSAAITSAGVW